MEEEEEVDDVEEVEKAEEVEEVAAVSASLILAKGSREASSAPCALALDEALVAVVAMMLLAVMLMPSCAEMYRPE